MASALNLKLSNLTPTIVKCGFPVDSLDKYLLMLKNSEYKVHIVKDNDFVNSINAFDFINNKSFQNILDDFLTTNIDELSISQAFDLLYDLQNKFKEIKKQ